MENRPLDNQPSPQIPPTPRRIPAGVLAGIIAIVLAGSGTAWFTWNRYQTNNAFPDTSPTTPATIQPSSPDSSPIASEQTAQVYWLKDTGTGFEVVPTPITVQAEEEPEALLKATFNELLKGPSGTEVSSTIPQGTQLLDLTIQDDGIHVNLSQDFTTGGGSASMSGRLAQVLYTATSLDPNASVWLSVEGKPLEVLGGEGIMVDQPMTRSAFEENFPL